MTRRPCRTRTLIALLAACAVAWGCSKKKADPTAGPQYAEGDGTTSPTTADGRGGPPGRGSGMRQIMMRIGRPPNGLSQRLDQALGTDQPDWAAIKPQAAEYAKLAADTTKGEPARGSTESWATQTAAFAAAAAELDKAAQAEDLAAARTAQQALNDSCMACHREHRAGPGGFGGKGPRGGPGGRPGGPGGPPRPPVGGEP